jgi:hypothetical protein
MYKKITIELTNYEYQGIKDYLKSVDCIENPTKADIQKEIQNLVSSNLQTGAVWDYINKRKNN